MDDDRALGDEDVARIGKALAHPARIQIVEQFERSTPRMVQEIVDASELAQSTVSEHLRVLREAGVVTTRKDGPRIWYEVDQAILRRYAEAIERITAGTEYSEPE